MKKYLQQRQLKKEKVIIYGLPLLLVISLFISVLINCFFYPFKFKEINFFYLILVELPILFLYLLYISKKVNIIYPLIKIAVVNLFVVLVLFSFSLLSLETYYRFYVDRTDSFSYTLISKRWFQRHYKLNKQGFRDDVEYFLKKDSKKSRRITFIGDSFTAGHGIESTEDRFVNIIRKQHPEWEIHCIAKNGNETMDEIMELNELVKKKYEVDIVVLCYCLNDISDLVSDTEEIYKALAQIDQQKATILEKSYFLNTIYWRVKIKNIKGVNSYYENLTKAYEGEIWKKQQSRIDAIQQLVEKNGGQLLVVTFPLLNFSKEDNRKIISTLKNNWKQMDIPHIDFEYLLSDGEPMDYMVNKYDAHPNKKSHLIFSEKINQFIMDNSN